MQKGEGGRTEDKRHLLDNLHSVSLWGVLLFQSVRGTCLGFIEQISMMPEVGRITRVSLSKFPSVGPGHEILGPGQALLTASFPARDQQWGRSLLCLPSMC